MGTHIKHKGDKLVPPHRNPRTFVNTVSSCNDGIGLNNSSGNFLTGNTSTSTDGVGIILQVSSNNQLSGIITGNNVGSPGLFLVSSSNNNTLNDNTSTGNDIGSYVLGSSRNVFTDNTALNNSQTDMIDETVGDDTFGTLNTWTNTTSGERCV